MNERRVKSIGCGPTGWMLLLLVVGAVLIWAGWVFLGPGTSEGVAFTEALRQNHLADATALAAPELEPRLRRVMHPAIYDGIDPLAQGKGSRDYFHARANWSERCMQFEGRRNDQILVVYVTLEKRPGGWLVTEVSLDRLASAICRDM